MQEDGVKIVVFPCGDEQGVIVEPKDLLNDLNKALEKYKNP